MGSLGDTGHGHGQCAQQTALWGFNVSQEPVKQKLGKSGKEKRTELQGESKDTTEQDRKRSEPEKGTDKITVSLREQCDGEKGKGNNIGSREEEISL